MSPPPSPTAGRPQPVNALLAVAAFVVVVAGLKSAVAIANPFLLALFVSIIFAPPLFALQSRGVPTAIALPVVIVAVIVIFLALGALVGTSVTGFTEALPGYQARLSEMGEAALANLESLGLPLSLDEVRNRLDAGAAMGMVGTLVAGLGGVLTNTLLILLTTTFMLLEAAAFKSKLAAIVDDPDASLARFDQVRSSVQRYLAIKTGTSLATGVLVGVWLLIVGVDFPLLWALLAFLLNYVPNIGSVIASVPAILLATVQLGWGAAGLTAAGYVAINVAIGSGIEPRLMGRGTGLSTLVVFVSLVFWGWVLGPVGMLLSVPLTMTAKVALEANRDTHWVAVLLGPSPAAAEGHGEAA